LAELQPKKIGIFKCGNIGTAPNLELLLDELADRKDIKVRVITSGSKMNPEDVEEALPKLFAFNPDVVVMISPNTALPGPSKAREAIANAKLPGIVITDAPGKKVKADIEQQGLGYLIITADPLIGARKEFLDPIEMAVFNSNVNKVLAIMDNNLSSLYEKVRQNPEADSLARPEILITLNVKTDSNKQLSKSDYDKLTEYMRVMTKVAIARIDELSLKLWGKSYLNLEMRQKLAVTKLLGYLLIVNIT